MAARLGPWRALSIEATARLMAGLDAPWWIAGGWAIDLFLGRTTRDHADTDVAILRDDQAALAGLLAGWDLHVAAGGALTPWAAPDWLEGGVRHQLWARPTPTSPWALEILLEEGDRESWSYRRDRRVRLPLGRFGRRTDAGVSYLAPEVALLFKSTAPDVEKNRLDFDAVFPNLDPAASAWLQDALRLTAPGHRWIERL